MTQLENQNHPLTVVPMDRYNQTLVENLHPPHWVNPEPAPRYNLVVIGGGTAGLVTAAGAALFGAKVALIEKHLLGGDCTNVGCVPSKAMIRSSRTVAEINRAKQYGVYPPEGTEVDFPAVMERLRRVRAEISPNDSAERMAEEYGVEVFLGEARFSSADTVEVAGKTLRFKKAAIATGSSPSTLPIEGLESAGYLTNETIFSLTERPTRLAVIGGGYIGCELAQTFQRLGSEVTLLQKSSRLLTNADAEAAQIIEQALRQDGVNVVLGAKTQRVSTNNGKTVEYQVENQQASVTVDEILVAVGRSPHVAELNLEAVGVEYNAKGIIINDYLQTSNPRIYALGDVAMKWKFTHAADAAARIVIQNALFSVGGIGRKKLSSLTMPWCTYTQPELAHVGISAEEAQRRAESIDTFCVPMEDVDRAIIDGETAGFAKVHLKKGTDQILGATIVAFQAGEMITTITLAMEKKLGLGAIASTIFPYPTQAEVIRKVASAYSMTRITPTIKKLASVWLQWRR